MNDGTASAAPRPSAGTGLTGSGGGGAQTGIAGEYVDEWRAAQQRT